MADMTGQFLFVLNSNIKDHMDGLVQDCSNSIAIAMELL